MVRVQAEAEAVMDARPEEVFAILSDYRNEHGQILPEQTFSNLVVEEGGIGAGTVFRVSTHVLGTQRDFHMVVSEPEPGRVLTETDTLSGLVTTFTLAPVNDGRKTRVRISTTWEASGGVGGFMDRLFTPRLMRQIYTRQLAQMEAYIRSKRKAVGGKLRD